MKNLVVVMFLMMVLVMFILFAIDFYNKQNNKEDHESLLSYEQVNEIVNDNSNDSDLQLDEIINKFHVFMGYPFQLSGLNRSQRRKIKRQHLKFLWNWHLIPEEKQSVKKICEFIISMDSNRWVIYNYCISK
jgi:hypothetical protein